MSCNVLNVPNEKLKLYEKPMRAINFFLIACPINIILGRANSVMFETVKSDYTIDFKKYQLLSC